jgi:hypothetical protein
MVAVLFNNSYLLLTLPGAAAANGTFVDIREGKNG